MNERMNIEWMVGSFDEDMIELMDGRMDGWMNIEWMASSYIEDMIELMDEWMNEY